MTRLLLLAITLGTLAAPAWAGETVGTAAGSPDMPAQEMATAPFAEFISPADSLPHLRYLADGKITLNDRCPVRKVRLNPRMGASYVNGQPVGFC